MNAGIKFDFKEFNQALRQCAAESSRTLQEEVNAHAFGVVTAAYRATPRVEKSAIDAALNANIETQVVGTKIRILKSGKVKQGKAIVQKVVHSIGASAGKLVNWQRGQAGLKGLHGDNMRAAIDEMVKKRRASVGTLRLGWLASINKLAAMVKGGKKRRGYRVKQPGSANPAKDTWNPTATFAYNLNIGQRKGSERLDPRVVTALEIGFATELASMKAKIQERLQRVFNKYKG